jgi:Fe-S oxidoreductase
MALKDYQEDVEMCCRCSTCKFVPMQQVKGIKYATVCPSISKFNFHAYSGGGKLNIANSLLKNKIQPNEKLLDVVYNCQVCGACGVSCNYAMDIKVLEPIVELRMKCVEDGKTNPALEKAVTEMKTTGSMVTSKAKRGAWAEGSNIKNAAKEKTDILFYVGCQVSADKDLWKLAKATAQILKKAGVDFGILGDAEICCGSRAYQMGYRDDFIAQAKKNMELIKKTGAKTIVTTCADGYQAFKVLYEEYNLRGDIEVLHITEYIDRLLKSGKLKLTGRVPITVTYHDPCRLGRLSEPFVPWKGQKKPGGFFMFDPPREYRRGTKGVYEPPRDILKAIPGLKLKEMTRIKEYAWCCGAGGGVYESNPEFSAWTAKERVEEATSTGAEAIATACPWCEKNFTDAARENKSSLKVYDIVELVEKAL